MPYINDLAREICFKVVYCGAGMSGKTTNLEYIHRVLSQAIRGEMTMLDAAEERTLFFDFFPLELGEIDGFRLRFNMYTVPGQVFYEASRRLIRDGADGVVFVADSQLSRFEANIASWQSMIASLESYGFDMGQFPVVLQYNKRDLHPRIEIGSLESTLGLNGIPVFGSVASRGIGVMETIRTLNRMVISRFDL